MSRRCRSSLQDLSEDDGDGSGSGGGCGPRFGTGVPCIEPIVYGSNILLDPGFELHLGITGGGPQEDEIPSTKWDRADIPEPDTLSPAFTDGSLALGTGWRAQINWLPFNGDPRQAAWVDTADPRSGDHHLRFTDAEIASPFGGDPGQIWAYSFQSCPLHRMFAARIEPFDLVTWTIYAKTTSTTPAPEVANMQLQWFDDEVTIHSPQTPLIPFASPIPLTTSYVQYGGQAFAPPGVRYLNPTILAKNTAAGTCSIDMDDAIFGLVPAANAQLLCAFASLITIDNSTTETSFI